MFYQWGRKDPFTFATSSLDNGDPSANPYGKYPVKIYNSTSELIYQEDNGGGNSDNTPVGGVITSRLVSSMMETVKKPNLFYYGGSSIISQVGQSKELWDYYWTSYSRGTDGQSHPVAILNWHNTYLDGYIVLRPKSIYNPCPYGYRIPTNGTYNELNSNYGWIRYSYLGGTVWISNWFSAIGYKNHYYVDSGSWGFFSSATIGASQYGYAFGIGSSYTQYNRHSWAQALGSSIRCIEDATDDPIKKERFTPLF